MAYETLRYRDGFVDGRPDARKDVRELQSALASAGYDVAADGLFGRGTETVVKAFQRAHNLGADGVVGPRTWDALSSRDKPAEADAGAPRLLPGFRGDLGWVHEREGHAGKPYWPGGASGVTLDPGIDLGHASPALISSAFASLLSAGQRDAVQRARGVRGEDARALLQTDVELRKIRVTRSEAARIFPLAAAPYWESIVRRFPRLAQDGTPGSVQTVFLSLSYNRGARNKGLAALEEPVADGNWTEVAERIGCMQQDHRLAGIRKRRRMEGDLIREEIA